MRLDRSPFYNFVAAVAYSLGLMLAILGGEAPVVAQHQVQSPARGFQPAGSYALSDIETISTKNGNLMLHIPLVQLPAGRGGMSSRIGLFYNSKLWESFTSVGTD